MAVRRRRVPAAARRAYIPPPEGWSQAASHGLQFSSDGLQCVSGLTSETSGRVTSGKRARRLLHRVGRAALRNRPRRGARGVSHGSGHDTQLRREAREASCGSPLSTARDLLPSRSRSPRDRRYPRTSRPRRCSCPTPSSRSAARAACAAKLLMSNNLSPPTDDSFHMELFMNFLISLTKMLKIHINI